MKFLLGLCFCPSCTIRATPAGLDLSALRKFTKTTLEACFEQPESHKEAYASLDQLPADLFDPFLSWRERVVVSLLEELHDAVGISGPKLRPLVSLSPLSRKMVSVDPAKCARITGGLLVPGYVKDGTALRGPLADLLEILPETDLTLGFQVGLPGSGGKSAFLSRMDVAREHGITSFNFYNYGFIPLSRLGWIKESLTI
jgi:hypothetical protein